MKTKIQIKSIFGKILFEHEKENNTIKDSVIEAVKSRANLSGANLSDANLSDANLSDANLSGANLSWADGLTLEKIKPFFWIVPEEGSFIGWKKLEHNCIAKLQIPALAQRTCNVKNRKCRAEYVKVLDIRDAENKKIKSALNTTHENKLLYESGKIIRADSFNNDFMEDCSHGIHFFVTKREAEIWN